MIRKGVIFIIFGATGDLTKRKLIPGIYNLIRRKRIKDFHIIGLARRPFTGEKLVNSSKKFIFKPEEKILRKLKKNTSYISANFRDANDYSLIESKIHELENEGMHDKIFYLATGANKFELISKNLQKTGVAKEKNCQTRIVYEKPFGADQKSSQKINTAIKKIFREDQIYRIDHYLGKELVEAVSVLRFTNRILEPIWNKENVKSIQIILDENIGIAERGAFYDTYGAVRDMVQNHMLQLLSLVTMEMPKSFSGNYMRDKKAKLLKSVRIKDSLVGQYSGYLKEKGIPPKSKTETFAAHVLEINNSRWKGVPIFFKTGKFLNRKSSKIVITFKTVKQLFEGSCPHEGNQLEIRIHPDEGIEFTLNVKQPGKKEAVPITLNFCYSCKFGPNTPEGYENLFAEIMQGDQTTFTREDELQNAWKVVDRVKRGKVYRYAKGSKGPKELAAFNKKWGIKWQ